MYLYIYKELRIFWNDSRIIFVQIDILETLDLNLQSLCSFVLLVFQGAIQGPEEFIEGMTIGVKALVGGAVGKNLTQLKLVGTCSLANKI